MRIRSVGRKALLSGFVAAVGLLVAAMAVDWMIDAPAAATGSSNQPPAAESGRDRTVAIGDTVVLDGSGSTDIDGDGLTFAWQLASTPSGSLAVLSNAAAVKPSVTIDLAGDYTVELTVDDGTAVSTVDSVRISTTNSAPVAGAGRDRAIALSETVILDASGSSDVDGDPLSYSWTLVSAPAGSGASIDFPNALRPSFFVDLAGTYVAELTVSDGSLTSIADQVVFSSGNLAPAPEAGPNRTVATGTALRLDPDGTTDADGDQLRARWALIARPAGSTASLSAPAGSRASVTPDVPGTYVVQLRTDDGTVRTVDTLALSTANTPPTADAGADQALLAGQTVSLDGAGSSDVDGGLLGYRWALLSTPAGSTAALDDPQLVRPEFTADLAGTYVAQLIVSDGTEQSAPDTVVFSTVNTAPVADAGSDLTAPQFSPVVLDGSGSFDADADAISYRWAVVTVEGGEFDDDDDGGGVILSDPTAISPVLTFGGGGDDDDGGDGDDDDGGMGYAVVQLLVSDGLLGSGPDSVLISTENSRPVANAGLDFEVPSLGGLAQLDGSFSNDADNDALTYRWSLIARPADSLATLSDAAIVNPRFTVDKAGLYVAQLIVNDGVLDSAPDTAVVLLANLPPVADAGPNQDVFVGQTVTLDGTGSTDPDLDPLTYAWTLTSVPNGSATVLSGETAANPTFVPDRAGDYVASLVVNDGVVDSAPDTVTATTVNRAPVADAGADQTVTQGATVALDGSASSDPDNDFLTFAWTLTARPSGSAAVLANGTSNAPNFAADAVGFYTLELIVNDGALESPVATVVVNATPVANTPPVLGAVGNQILALGSTLSLTLTATDAEADPLSFFASPTPLPDAASLDASTGDFTFRPGQSQVGDVTLTFSVSDGRASDTEAISITVTGAAPGGITALTGRLLDAVAADAGQTVPVVGATLTIAGQSVFTDAQGSFILSGIPAGEQVLDIDGSTAAIAPDGAPYGGLKTQQKLAFGVTNNAEGDFFLPRVDLTTAQTYDPAATTDLTVSNSALGASLIVTAGSAAQDGAAYAGTITVSDSVSGQLLAVLPPLIAPCTAVSIQPFDLAFSPPAAVILPNSDNLPVGALVDIWSADSATGAGAVVAVGQVATVSTITTLSGGVPGGGLVFAVPRPAAVFAAADENADNIRPTTLADGNLFRSVSLPSYRSLDQDRRQTFVYNSVAAAPTPIVAAEVTFPADGGLPALVSGRLEVGGVTAAGPVFTSTSDPAPLAAGGTIRQALQFPAKDLPTGSYPYRYVSTSNYACSKVGAAFDGQVLVNNEDESPFGRGWSLAGLERLTMLDDGDVVLTEGDGTAKVFDLTPTGLFHDPLGIPLGWPGAAALDDLDGDGHLDIAVPGMIPGNVTLLFGDGAGGFPIDTRFIAGTPRSPQFFPDTHTIATGDFNEDGNRDLVVNNQNSGRVRIYSGTGGGLFAAVPTDIGVTRPQGLGVADFNLDGHDDIVVATSGGPSSGHQAFVYFGNGLGGFPNSRVIGLGRLQAGLTIADFDNNGVPDIALAAATEDTVYILRSDGFGDFIVSSTPVGLIRWEIGRYPLAAADFNGDGNQDLAVTIENATTVTVLFGDGAGGFISSVAAPTGSEANSVAAADIDHDGDMDIVASRRDGIVSLALGDGAGGFTAAADVPVGGIGRLFAVTLGDFNEDGVLDLQTGSGSEDKVFVLTADLSGGSYRSPGADFSALARNIDGSFVRRMKDGTVIEYNADGLMTARVDRNGNRAEYSYGAGGLLAGISDPANPANSTTFDYAGGTLSSVTDPVGRTTFFTVDAAGKLTEITDADGSLRKFAYDANGRMASELSKRGFATSHDYGFAGQWAGSSFPDGASVTAQISKSLGLADLGFGLGTEGNPAPYAVPDGTANLTDARGNSYTMRFNRFGSVVEVTDPIMRTTVVTRDDDDLIVAVEAPSDGELPDGSTPGTVGTELDYDDLGNVILQREAAGTTLERETRFTYEPVFNQVTRIIDPSNTLADPPCATPAAPPAAAAPSPGVTCFEYDANGNQTRVIDGLGDTQVTSYDGRGLRTGDTDPNGNLTQFIYNTVTFNLDRVILASGDPDSQTETRFARDSRGNVTRTIEGFGAPEARTTVATFDDLNRLLSDTDGAGGTTTRRYDAAGNEAETVDATGIVTTRTFDSRDRLLAETDPAVGTVARGYDANGNLETIANALNNSVALHYDEVNRVTRTTGPLLNDRLFDYDSADNLTSVTDARQAALIDGKPTLFAFDPLNRRIRRTDPLGAVWSFAYDRRDNLTRTDDAKGQAIVRAYDALSRLESITSTDAAGLEEDVVAFTYDATGNRLSATDNDSALDFTYDARNRMQTAATRDATTWPGAVQPAVTLNSTYDLVGNRSGLTHGPNALTVDGSWRYSHDGAGRLASLVHPTGDPLNPLTMAYDPAGRLTRIEFPNAVVTDVSYDAAGRPVGIVHGQAQAELARFDYGYFSDGLVRSITEAGGTRNFTYDAAQQLTSGGFSAALESYTYDEEGNRIASHLSAAYSYDDANRLRQDDAFCYAYDANGNLATKTEQVAGACTGVAVTYSWDVQNRLTGIAFPDGTTADYRYDADDRRIGKDALGASTRYVYDDDDILLEYDGAGNLQASYGHGMAVDQPLVMERSGENYFYQSDQLGSIRTVTDSSGLVVNSYNYDSYGILETSSIITVVNPYAFTAREFDTNSNHYFYRARYYDPDFGRFISEDPIGFGSADLNKYRYAGNSPSTFIDPRGEFISFAWLARGARTRVAAGLIVLKAAQFIVRETIRTAIREARRDLRKANVVDIVNIYIDFQRGLNGEKLVLPPPGPGDSRTANAIRKLANSIGGLFAGKIRIPKSGEIGTPKSCEIRILKSCEIRIPI